MSIVTLHDAGFAPGAGRTDLCKPLTQCCLFLFGRARGQQVKVAITITNHEDHVELLNPGSKRTSFQILCSRVVSLYTL